MLVWSAAALVAEPVKLVSNAGALNNQALGVALSEVYRRAGVEMTITALPAERAAYMLDNGAFDGVVGRVSRFGVTRPDLIKLEPPINSIVTTAFFLQNQGHQIAHKDDLQGKTAGVVRGIAHARRATQDAAIVIEVESARQLFLMLFAKRIDVAVHGHFSARVEIQSFEDKNTPLNEVTIGTLHSHHFLRNSRRKEAALIAIVLREMVNTGEFGALFQAERARLIAQAQVEHH